MMRMSKSFGERWHDQRIDEAVEQATLQPRLQELVESPLVRKAGSLVLLPLATNASGPDAFQDRTGYEAFVNKVHIDDFIDQRNGSREAQLRQLILQGVKASITLSTRLESEGNYRILLSLDPDLPTVTLRFFERRPGEPWGAEDPDAFQFEEVLMIDTRL